MTSVCIVAGEASGDKQAALLVNALRTEWHSQLTSHTPNDVLEFWGVAGPDMRQAGVEAIFQTEQLAVMGLIEVVAHYFSISSLYKSLLSEIEVRRPDVLIVVDYPGFNLRLAADVFGLGIPVFYHIPPKVWAHGKARVEKLAAYTHLVTCILPFEEGMLRANGVVTKFIGNPLFDTCEQFLQKNKAHSERRAIGPREDVLIGLCPGSRRSEIRYVLPVMVAAFKQLLESVPVASGVIPVAATLERAWMEAQLAACGLSSAARSRITLTTEPFVDVVARCDYAWVCSGTATLETAFLQVPHSIVYRMNAASFWIAKMLVRIPYIGLANWCAERLIVPEFLQHEATPENLVAHARTLLFDGHARQQFLSQLASVRTKFPFDAAKHAAQVMLRALELYGDSPFERNWLRSRALQENWL